MSESAEPSLKIIANLFSVPEATDLVISEEGRKKQGDTAAECAELGRQCLTDGDYETAIRHFRRAVELSPASDVKALIDLAGAYEFGDEYPHALRQYEKALRAQQEIGEPHVGIADVFKRYGRFKDAVESLEASIRQEPDNAFFHFKLAETLRDAGEPRRALKSAQYAVLLKPDQSFYHYWAGDLQIQIGDYSDALDSLRAAIELSPGDDFLYFRASVAFWRADRKPEAIKAVRLASDLDPNKHLYHGLLGILLEELGQFDEAILESDRAEKMDRYDHDLLSRVLDEMGIEA